MTTVTGCGGGAAYPATMKKAPRGTVVLLGAALVITVSALTVLVSSRLVGSKDVFELTVGDCVNGLAAAGHDAVEFASTPVVPCDEPHEAEVLASFRLDGGSYPGEASVVEESQARCGDLMAAELKSEADAGARHEGLMPFYFYPTSASWERADDRTVHCLALHAGGPATGSLLGP